MRLGQRLAVACLMGATLLGASCRRADLAYCDKSCSCTGCDATQQRDCEDGVDDARKVANDAGCLQQYDDFASCQSAEFECTNGAVTTDGCSPELTALVACAL